MLEQRLAAVEQHATHDNYGIVRLSDSESVTDAEGLALPVTEKNASIPGTLAGKIGKLEDICTLEPVQLCGELTGLTAVTTVNVRDISGFRFVFFVIAGYGTCFGHAIAPISLFKAFQPYGCNVNAHWADRFIYGQVRYVSDTQLAVYFEPTDISFRLYAF